MLKPEMPEMLVVSKLPPFLMDPLQQAYTVHDRIRETDAAAFELAPTRTRAVARARQAQSR